MELLREETLENEFAKVKQEAPGDENFEDSDDADELKEIGDPTSHVRTPRDHYWTRKRGWNSSDGDNNFYSFNLIPNWLNWYYYPYGYGRKKRDVQEKSPEKGDSVIGEDTGHARKASILWVSQIERPYPLVFICSFLSFSLIF